MKIKWNWGWGIFLTIVIFMGIIVAIVASMMNREVDLVTDRYYDKEIKFQQQIDKEKRTAALNENIKIDYSGRQSPFHFRKLINRKENFIFTVLQTCIKILKYR